LWRQFIDLNLWLDSDLIVYTIMWIIKDAKPILQKYLAMAHELFQPHDFGRRIFIERVCTSQNPADSLTRHYLLHQFVKFARASDDDFPAVDTDVKKDYSTAAVYSDYRRLPQVALVAAAGENGSHTLPTPNAIKEGQHQDHQLQVILSTLQQHREPPDGVDRAYTLVWNTLVVRDGILRRLLPATHGAGLAEVVVVPVVPDKLVPRVLVYFHNPLGANHPGIQRTIRAIKQLYWFPKLSKRVCDHISSCSACILRAMKQKWTQTGVQKAAPPGPWHTVAADLLSVSTDSGNILLLVTLCLFSFWPEVRVLSSKSSQAVALALRSMNAQFGPMKILRTDRGPEFRGAVEEYLTTINAVHSTTLPYSPVSAVEQLNRTILHKLQTVRNCPLWRRIPTVALLDEILWSIRSTPST
ncbi:hypothetical protein FOZ63_010398, partial [Perkinsus olseni]